MFIGVLKPNSWVSKTLFRLSYISNFFQQLSMKHFYKPPLNLFFYFKVNSMIKSSFNEANHSLSSSSGISTLRSGRSCSGSGWATVNNSSNNMNKNKNSTSSLAYLFNRQNSISNNTCVNVNANPNDLACNTTPFSLANNISISFASESNNFSNDQYLTSMLFENYMEFPEFVNLFKSFYIHMRKDLKDIYEHYAILVKSKDTNDQNFEITWQSIRKLWKNLIYKDNQNYLNQQQTAPSSFENDLQIINDKLTTLTRNNLNDELEMINSFKDLIDSTDATLVGSKVSLGQIKEKYKDLLFHLQNQLVLLNNNRLFYDLVASSSISPYTVNCSSEMLILNYFRY